ncbi:conserved hypothetical protein [Neospora caninum Liverpool]|uniref:Transmembrane protein n=1 Tax=Neospora caninum (strain Liverpool) TaxID=572307 RepID=F0VGK2_NEOCL|nr:conserved hypothetical protein [Neospora caninum Liverpool]CBZ52846.1 conserved hypothetical protein [Neospora caninum Liverpool]CEL66826.1 TPA: hypothetical protein BN1204_026350 [Neospora caninum Liverpool]|eukprot:XP_003882878.1 conserved hypothetical protein [Neospora caninum Liverpool]
MDTTQMQEHHQAAGPLAPEEALRCETLNIFRSQLHQLSRHKDRLMPKPDGSFPGDWLRLAWEYQSLAEQMMRSQRWPGDYPEGLLACVSEQVKYLRRRLGNFSSIPDEDKKDKFRRVYVLAALGIIAKLKLVTFCWTFVELKRGEQYAAYASSQGLPGNMLSQAGSGLMPDDLSGYCPNLPAFSQHGVCTSGCGPDGCPHKHPARPGDASGVSADGLLDMQGAGLLMGASGTGSLMLQGGNGAGLGAGPLGLYDQQLVPPGMSLEDLERTEYTTRSGRKTHRTAVRAEKS